MHGEWQRTIGSRGDQPGLFNELKGLALTPDEDFLLVVDQGNRRVTVLRAWDGAWVRQLTGPPNTLQNPDSVAVVPSTGEVLVSDVSRHRVIRFRSFDNDTVVGTLGTGRGSGPTEFQFPYGLVVLDGVNRPVVCVYFNLRPYFAFFPIVVNTDLDTFPFFVSTCDGSFSGGPRGRGGRSLEPSFGPVAPGRWHRVEATGIARHGAGAVYLPPGRGGDECWGVGGQ